MKGVDLSAFRPEFIEGERRQREARLCLRDELWKQREELRGLLGGELPAMDRFHHLLEDRGDVAAAIGTGHLVALEKQGFLTNDEAFVSADLLKRGGRVWSLRWIAHGVAGVDRSLETPRAADQWNEVVLQVGIDPKKRRIDSEFFSLNEAFGDAEAAYDDREKFHIVWELTEKNELRLSYVGLGTNEPYDLEHEDRSVARSSGRPRFYIFDADRGMTLRYEIDWRDEGQFDWDWSARPVDIRGKERDVSFVEFTDGTRFCVSDPEVARAASGWTWDAVRQGAEALCGGPLSSHGESELRGYFRRWRATVRGPIEEVLPRSAPDLQLLVGRPGCDYVAYFVASTLAGQKERSAADIIKATRRLEPSRRQEYESLLARPCQEVFVDEISDALPKTMGELVDFDASRLNARPRTAIEGWVQKIAEEARRDLYYYGQSPVERMNRLRLGAYLALSERHGGMYHKVVAQARRLLLGEQPHGRFAVQLA